MYDLKNLFTFYYLFFNVMHFVKVHFVKCVIKILIYKQTNKQTNK